MTTVKSFISDEYLSGAKIAMDGLSSRQQAISRNVANIDTPGYRAQTVSFEKAVKLALARDDAMQVKTTNERHQVPANQYIGISSEFRPGGSLRVDENNVDLDVELMDMNEVTLRYQTLTQELTKKYSLLKTIAMSR